MTSTAPARVTPVPLILIGGVILAVGGWWLAGAGAGMPFASSAAPGGQLVAGSGSMALALARLGFDLAAAVTIGAGCAAVLWLPSGEAGTATPQIRLACRIAAWAAGVWALAAGLLLVNVLGQRAGGAALLGGIPQPSGPAAAAAAGNLPTAQSGYLITIGLALLVALLALGRGREAVRVLTLLAAVGAMLPRAFIGNNAEPLNRDYAIDATVLNRLGFSVWLGGLVVVLVLVRRSGDETSDVLWRRYRAAAVVAAAVVLGSAVLMALLRLAGHNPLNSGYGRLTLIALVLVLAAAALLLLRRQSAARRAERAAAPGLPVAVELGLLAAAAGVVACVGVIVPPSAAEPVTTVQSILGFELYGAPTFWKILWDWRFDLLLGGGAVLAAGLYLRGVRTLKARGIAWSGKRTTAWLCGTGLLLLVSSSGLDRYALSQFSLHMILHMSIGMLVPILLVLGGPLTLALRVLPAAGRSGPPGLREALLRLLHSRVVRFVSHPGFAVPLFVGSFYAIYFTGLFELLISTHGGHVAMNLHLLLVGWLYYWQVIGVDPAPRRYPALFRLGLLMAPIPFHSIFGLTVMNSRTLIAGDYYHSLGLPWMTNLLSDQKLGGAIAWALADIPTAIVVVSLVAQWFRNDEREARRIDRRFADGRPDQELTAYNDMLARLNQRESSGREAPTDHR